MINRREVSEQHQEAMPGLEMTTPRAADLAILGTLWVSEGGLELLSAPERRGSSGYINPRGDQRNAPVGPSRETFGSIRIHGRQYRAEYHGRYRTRGPPSPCWPPSPNKAAPDAVITTPAGALIGTEVRPMSTISCAHELCAADDHEATTPEQVRHHRVTSDAGAEHHITATWTGTLYEPANEQVTMTFEGTTVTLTAREAAFWARLMTRGGMWTPALDTGTSTSEIAIDLATAAEVLLLLDGDAEPPDFGSRYLSRAVDHAIGAMLPDDEDEDEPAHVGGDR